MRWQALNFAVVYGDGSVMGEIRRINKFWPKRIGVTDEFVKYADPQFAQWGEGALTFTVAGEAATYRVLGRGSDLVPYTWDCELVEVRTR